MEYLYLLICLAVIVFSADALVAGAVTIAKRFKISDFVSSVTAVKHPKFFVCFCCFKAKQVGHSYKSIFLEQNFQFLQSLDL